MFGRYLKDLDCHQEWTVTLKRLTKLYRLMIQGFEHDVCSLVKLLLSFLITINAKVPLVFLVSFIILQSKRVSSKVNCLATFEDQPQYQTISNSFNNFYSKDF